MCGIHNSDLIKEAGKYFCAILSPHYSVPKMEISLLLTNEDYDI